MHLSSRFSIIPPIIRNGELHAVGDSGLVLWLLAEFGGQHGRFSTLCSMFFFANYIWLLDPTVVVPCLLVLRYRIGNGRLCWTSDFPL